MTSPPFADVGPEDTPRVRQQAVVAELGQQALETDDLDRLMDDATTAIVETLAADHATVRELSDGDELVVRQGTNCPGDRGNSVTMPTDPDTWSGQALRSDAPVVVDDLRTETRFSESTLPADHDVVSGISVVIGSTDDPWGLLSVGTTDRREFTDHDGTFIQSVANVLASAISKVRTKDRLREREAELEQVYGRVTDGFLALDESWTFTHVNDRAETILGVDRDDVLGEVIWTVFPELVGTAFETHYREAIGSQEPISIETYYSPFEAWFEERIYPSESGLSVYFKDVTEQKRLEEELEQTFDRITDAFIGLDRNWEISYVNDHGTELLDPDDEGLVGRDFWDPFEPALGTTFEEEYREAMATQEPTSFEAYYPPLDIRFEVHAYPSESGLSIYFRDVTERKQREREHELFRTLLDHTTDSVLVIDPETAQFIDVNETASRRLGYDREELTDLTVPEIERRFEDLEAWHDHVEAVRDAGSITVEGVHERRDGSTYPAEVNVTYVDLDREYLVAIARDITDRRERERRLRESKQQYRTLAENFPNGVVTMFDDDLEYVLAAGRAFDDLPVAPTDVEGESVRTVWPDHVSEAIESAFHSGPDGRPQTVETEYAGRDWVIHVVPIDDHEGNVFGGMTLAQDITERKEYERKLEESNERLEQFAYAASHDLQEPLRMVTSYLQLLERRYDDVFDEDGEEFLAFAVDGAERMREMIDGLLAYSRIDTQGDPLEPVDLNDLLEDVQEDLQMCIEETDARITSADLPRVEGDPTQLRQVFQNLLSNAIQYSGDDSPVVHVDAEHRGRRWELSVHDEGIGIPSDQQDRVFEVFQRLHSREEQSGTGIGLALCRRIVERHGGRIRLESEPGEGSTFSLTLPAAE
ncbi:PAS domain S-box protein [Halopiger goleimassiliensis]|uniref:PAS domain S-box protein n=1 Tax=Halopiger goleimassiliensis TaxID=1293048 RepID=UPI000677D5DD|nr:PAS domain S-box protein [Halopiger goleimassiliensis]